MFNTCVQYKYKALVSLQVDGSSPIEYNATVESRRTMFEAEPSGAPRPQPQPQPQAAHRVGNANANANANVNGGSSALSVHAPHPQQVVLRTASAPSTQPTRQPTQAAQEDRVTALCAKVDVLSAEVQALRLELRAFLAAPRPPPEADAKPASSLSPSPVLCARCACELPAEQTNGAPFESTRNSHYLSAVDGDAEHPLSSPVAPLAAGEEAAADTFA